MNRGNFYLKLGLLAMVFAGISLDLGAAAPRREKVNKKKRCLDGTPVCEKVWPAEGDYQIDHNKLCKDAILDDIVPWVEQAINCGADVMFVDRHNKTFLDLAKSEAVRQVLLKKMSEIVLDYTGEFAHFWTPLMRAVFAKDTFSLRMNLLKLLPVGINERNSAGRTALMCAAQAGYLEEVKALIKADADVLAADYAGKIASNYAEGAVNSHEICRALARRDTGLAGAAAGAGAGAGCAMPTLCPKVATDLPFNFSTVKFGTGSWSLPPKSTQDISMPRYVPVPTEFDTRMVAADYAEAMCRPPGGDGDDAGGCVHEILMDDDVAPLADCDKQKLQADFIQAVQEGRLTDAQQCCAGGADVLLMDKQGKIALDFAKTVDVRDFLLCEMKKVITPAYIQKLTREEVCGKDGADNPWTPLMLTIYAAGKGGINRVGLHVAENGCFESGILEEANQYGRRPLMCAAQVGDKKIVSYFLRQGASCASQDAAGKTAYDYVPAGSEYDAIRALLLESGLELLPEASKRDTDQEVFKYLEEASCFK